MKKIMHACVSCLLFFIVLLLDRITKTYALRHYITPYKFNAYLSADLTINRGISWGMCSFEDSRLCIMISGIVIVVTLLLALYTLSRFYHGHPIIGETLVLAGAISNSIDRFWYGGVIDFILLSYSSWMFPVFNVADVCIVLGVTCMYFLNISDRR